MADPVAGAKKAIGKVPGFLKGAFKAAVVVGGIGALGLAISAGAGLPLVGAAAGTSATGAATTTISLKGAALTSLNGLAHGTSEVAQFLAVGAGKVAAAVGPAPASA